jgi:hypothetical protein
MPRVAPIGNRIQRAQAGSSLRWKDRDDRDSCRRRYDWSWNGSCFASSPQKSVGRIRTETYERSKDVKRRTFNPGPHWSLAGALAVTLGCGSGAQSVRPTSAAEPDYAAHEEHEHQGAGAPPRAPAESTGPTAAQEPAAGDPVADVRAAYERARPVFEKYCTKCHTTGGTQSKKAALQHFTMDQYPFGGHHASAVAASIREVLGAGGEEPSMPRDEPGAVQGEELALVLAWADAFDRAHGTTTYTCPMHSDVRQPAPGTCPRCGMSLVPAKADANE